MFATVEDLRIEIERRTTEQHGSVVIRAIDTILAKIQASPGINCTYYWYFNKYRQLGSLRTAVIRAYDECSTFEMDRLNALDVRIKQLDESIEALRWQRYERVCGKCDACATRRTRWPEMATFVREEPALTLFE